MIHRLPLQEQLFFLLYKKFTLFFWFYKTCWEVLKKYISQLTLKSLNVGTRWSSGGNVLKPLRYHLCEIYDSLFRKIEGAKRDAETKVKVRGLAKNIKNYLYAV